MHKSQTDQEPTSEVVFGDIFQDLRPELLAYVTRLVVRPAVAEELVQAAAVRALQAIGSMPENHEEIRPWLFRIVTNLAIDERRRHGNWRETTMVEAHEHALADNGWRKEIQAMVGSPERHAAVKEHLAICFSCVLGRLPEDQAAVLLLKEIYGFENESAGEIVGATVNQVKNRLQTARASMRDYYQDNCTLINKKGVCHQCQQLNDIFTGDKKPVLPEGHEPVDHHISNLRAMRNDTYGRWGQLVVAILDSME